MPTARELLEQADALMRRNRARAVDTDVDTDIPELTDAIPDAVVVPPPPATLDEVPELTDAVEEIEIASIAELPEDRELPSEWLRLDRDARVGADDIGIADAAEAAPALPGAAEEAPTDSTGGWPPPEIGADAAAEAAAETAEAPLVSAVVEPETAMFPVDSVVMEVPAEVTPPFASSPAPEMVVASVSMEGAGPTPAQDVAAASVSMEGTAPSLASEWATPSAPAAATDDWARWQALAEEIRMQVLQRIDIFTDTGLREQLGGQLQPIVDRASADMVHTINEQVGKLLRAYIAEAIEREIEKWRRGNT